MACAKAWTASRRSVSTASLPTVSFLAALPQSSARAVAPLEFRVFRSGLLPRDVWQGLVSCRGDGKSLDAPLTFVQYARMKSLLAAANHAETVVSVEDVPEWVLGMIRAAEARDVEYSQLRASQVESQSDRDLQYVTDLIRLGQTGRDMAASILPYQLEGARFGLKRGGRCLVADEMGLGKTLQALMIAYQYKQEWPLLVVCPSSIRFVWRDQITRWFAGLINPQRDVQVVMRGKDVVSRDAKIVIIPYILLEPNEHLQSRAGDKLPYKVVVCDESHYIKDPHSKRSKAVQKLLKKANRIVLLSGTPSMNNAEELYPQMVHLLPSGPGAVKKPTLTEFRARYCVRTDFQVRGFPIAKYGGARNKEELFALLSKAVMIRRMKADVLTELPDKIRHRVELDVENSIFAAKVQEMTQKWLATSQGKSVASNTPSAQQYGIETMELWRLTGQAKLAAVKEYVTELLSSGGSDFKFILFAHHKFVMEGLEQLLARSLPPGGYIRVDGSLSSEKRAPLVHQFQNDPACRVALLSVTSCAEGITLTAANIVVFSEMYWVPGLLEQAEARAHRVGQKDCVVCYYLVLPQSPDEVIFNLLEKKKKDTTAIMDGSESGMIQRRHSSQASSSHAQDLTDAELMEMAQLLDDESQWTSLTPDPKRARIDLE